MYRAQNFNGWGPASDIGYFVTATVPNIPPPPIYSGSTATTVRLDFIQPEVLGGSPLTAYKLYVDTLSEFANFRLVYSGLAPTYTASTLTDSLSAGAAYRFVLVCSNVFGDSLPS